MDTIIAYDENGNASEKEVILILNAEDKNYIMYRDISGIQKNIYASYFYGDIDNENLQLYNNLTEDEYQMLEDVYRKEYEEYDN